MMNFYLQLVFVSLVLFSQHVLAEPTSLESATVKPLGFNIPFASDALSDNVSVDIYLPASYYKSTKSYPVIYLFDSEYLFDYTVANMKARWQRELAPESIIVGVNTTSFSTRINFAMPIKRPNGSIFAGHAKPEKMAQFLSKELSLYVEKHYRTAPYRIGIGLSPTATNIIYDFIAKKPFFNAHIAIASDLHFTALDDTPLHQLISDKIAKRPSSFFYHSKAMSDFNQDDSGKALYLSLHQKSNGNQGRFITDVPENTEHYAVAITSINRAFMHLFPTHVWLPDYAEFRRSLKPAQTLADFYATRNNQVGYPTYPLVESYWSINNVKALTEHLIRQKQLREARELLAWATALLPSNAQLHLMMSNVLMQLDEKDLAAQHGNVAMTLALQQGAETAHFSLTLPAINRYVK